MSSQYGDIDEHIDRLKNGGTLTENEVKNLCEKVREISRRCSFFSI
jgi:serine/threonine-protein phosphatase 2A catalytic subunit